LDAEDPEITCSADQVQSTDPGVCEAAVVVVSPAFSDNCVGASISNNITGTDDASGTYPLGTTTITWTVSDAAGNTAQCTQEIGVNDDEFPQITCSADVLQTADADACEAVVGVIAPLISDNCAGSVLINDYNGTSDGTDSYPVGSTDVTWTVTDASGNSTTCVQVIEIMDDQLPMAVCMDISIGLDLGGNASILASDVDGGSTDNCGITSMSVFPNSFTNADLGANNVTLTVEDAAGNSSSCVAVVTVTDDIPPTAVCQDITVVLDGLGSATITGEDIDGGSTDNGTIVSYEADPAIFTCAEVGANAVTLTVTDDGGLTGTCIATVTVLDEEDPVAVCKDTTLYLNDLGEAVIVSDQLDGGSSDNCAVQSFLADQNTFNCNDIGVNTVQLTVQDFSLNESMCTSTVSVLDTISPAITCPEALTIPAAFGSCDTALMDLGNAIVNDACGIDSTWNNAPELFTIGSTSVLWTTVDLQGNQSTCNQQIVVVDDQVPAITCPNDTLVSTAFNQCETFVNGLFVEVSDNCGDDGLIVSNSFNANGQDASDTYPIGETIVSFVVQDAANNINQCTFTVQVADEQVPDITCPSDTTLSADLDACSAWFTYDIPLGIDNCAGAITIQTDGTGFTSGDQFPVGTTDQQFTVTDAAGLDSTCAFQVTVLDEQKPNIACIADIEIFLDEGGTTILDAMDVDNGSSDACGLDTLYLTKSEFFCSDLGDNFSWLVGIDIHGNIDSCALVVHVTVSDNTPPTVICRDTLVYLDHNGLVAINPEMVDNGSFDACSIDTMYLSLDTLFCGSVPQASIWLYAMDGSGNIDSCETEITVVDTIQPQLQCRDITLYLDNTGNASLLADSIDNGSFDACGLDTLFLSKNEFSCSDLGLDTIALVGIDVNGIVIPAMHRCRFWIPFLLWLNVKIPWFIWILWASLKWTFPTLTRYPMILAE
jgi:uncharacterized lipoprotein NlpE involved in copper resistance